MKFRTKKKNERYDSTKAKKLISTNITRRFNRITMTPAQIKLRTRT